MSDDGHQDLCQRAHALDGADGEWQSQPEHQVAEDAIVAHIGEGAGDAPAIDARQHKGTLLMDVAGKLVLDDTPHFSFECVFQSIAICHGGLFNPLDGFKH